MDKGAHFSNDGVYRYALWRVWEQPAPQVLFIGLNPSTADAYDDDHTITKCIRFTRDWGYGGFRMVNLFAFMATKPHNMKKAVDPVGRYNNETIIINADMSELIVPMWGNDGAHQGRDKEVLKLLEGEDLYCFKKTQGGHPHHPLMLSYKTRLELFN